MDDQEGTKSTKYSLNEHPKNNIFVCLTATASGCKLKPLIIMPFEKSPRNLYPPNDVVIHYQIGNTK